MESEKIIEIKEYLEEEVFIATEFEDKLRRIPTRDLQKILTLINELESESERLNNEYDKAFERLRNQQKEIDRLSRRIAELEQDLIHVDEKVFYREQNVKLHEEEIKSEARKETAKEIVEKLKEKTHNYYPSIDSYCCSIKVVKLKEIYELLKEYEVEE